MTATARRSPFPVLNGYDVLQKIAEGSMATVYRGRRQADGATVAIKVPHPTLATSPVLQQRFHQEFLVGERVRHSHVVQTLDFGRERGTFFLVLEYVDGQNLWQRVVDGGPLPEREAIEIIAQAAEGLHELHRHGLVHRDVKPENILLTADGRAKLADLGLIKDVRTGLRLTGANKGMGSPNFTAPEQFTAAREADVRCDVYSLAATLYATVTGELPFKARGIPGVLRKKQANDLTPPRHFNRMLSDRLEVAIRRALLADPARRHHNCVEFVKALPGAVARSAAAKGEKDSRGLHARLPRPADRRRAVRYPCTLATLCDLRISIHANESDAAESWQVTVQDLSIGGIGLLLPRRCEPGTVLALLLESPDQGFRRILELKVIRVRKTAVGQWFVGGSFTDPLSKEDLRQLV